MKQLLAALLVGAIAMFAGDSKAPEPPKAPALSMEKKFAGAQLQKRVLEAAAVQQINKRDVEIATRAAERSDVNAKTVNEEWKRWEAEALKEIKAPDGCLINTELEVQCPPKPEVKK